MYGFHIDTLLLVRHDIRKPQLKTILWRESGQKDENWHEALVRVTLDYYTQVRKGVSVIFRKLSSGQRNEQNTQQLNRIALKTRTVIPY